MSRGRSRNDNVNGSNRSEFISTGRGNDTINANDGHDWIIAGSGHDEINAGAGNDFVIAGSGNDTVDGGSGNDFILGGSGNDVIDGGLGRDYVLAGSGQDTLIYTLPEVGSSSCWPDYYNGGSGIDTLQINLTAAQYADTALVAELSAFLDGIESGTAGRCTWLPSLNLVVTSIEQVEIYVDGVLTDPRDTGGGDVVAVDDSFTVDEDNSLSDSVASNDTVPSGATFTLLTPVTAGTLILNGDGSFTFDTNGQFDNLAEGETATQSFTYQLSLGGQTVTATAEITITGTNDAPTVASALTTAIGEDDGPVSIDLLQGATDVDTNDTLSVTNVSALPAGVSLSGTTLTVDPLGPSIQSLAEGEVLEIVVSYDIEDGNGGSVAQTATVTITGANDAPVISGAITANVAEGDPVMMIDLLQGASDIDAGDTLGIANVSTLPDGVTRSGTTLVIDPAADAFNDLAEGEMREITVTFDVVDAQGASVPQTVILTVTGTNDAPVVSGPVQALVSEDASPISIDLLDGASDPDNLATLSVTSLSTLPVGFSVVGNTLTVDPSDPTYQALAVGETLEQVITFDVVDENGASVPQTAVITIVGQNDAPTVVATLSETVAEDDAALSIDLLVGASDVDLRGALSVQLLGALPSGVTLTGTSLTVDPSDASFQSLAEGSSTTLTIAYDIVDDQGASVRQTATIVITGTNDSPSVAFALTAAADEDDTVFTMDLLNGATDVDDGAVLSVANVSGLTAGITLVGETLTVDPGDMAFQALELGQTQDIVISYDVVDENGARVPQTATITITGTNDAPVVAAPLTASADEDASIFTLDLLDGASDVDTNATLSVRNVLGLGGGMSVVGSTLTVDPSASTYQSLNVGDTREVTITYDVIDEYGASAPQTATITIVGTNDAPTVIGGLTVPLAEDGAAVELDLLTGASDIDVGAVLSVANVTGLSAGMTLVNNTLSIDPSDGAYQSLNVGESVEIVVSFDVVDEHGAAVPQTATITITGTNDAPTVAAALSVSAAEDAAPFSVDLLQGASDIDNGAVLTVANIAGLPTWASLSGTDLGVDPGHPDLQALAVGDVLTTTVTFDVVDENGASVPQSIELTITGTNDAPSIAAASRDVSEDASGISLDLRDLGSDVDGDNDGTDLSYSIVSGPSEGQAALFGALLQFNTNGAFEDLAEGETRQVTIEVQAEDRHGATATNVVTITVTGENDAPTVAAALIASADEDSATFALDLLDGAADVDNGAVLSIQNVSGLGAGMALTDTILTVDPSDAMYQSLNVGDSLDVVVTYEVVDEFGSTVQQTATITINGTNDAPEVSAAISTGAAEDDAVFAVELLDGATDVDAGATLSVENLSGLVSGMTLSGTTLTIDPSDAAFQSLALGETQEIVLTYDVADENGASVPQTATITITGTNDAPTVAAALSASAAEDGAALSIDLLEGASDVDNGAVLSIANLSTLPAGLVLNGNSLEVDPGDPAFQSLNVGQSEIITVSYDVVDENGASVPQTATITITGTNDAPTVDAALSETTDEDDPVLTINLLDGASDIDTGATLSVANVAGLAPGFTLVGDTLEVDPSDPFYQSLAVGESVSFTVTYDVTDENGSSVPQSVTVEVNGTNDIPFVTGAIDTQFAQTGVAFTLTLDPGLFDDVDTSDTLTLSANLADGSPLPSWLSFDPVTGTFSGTPPDNRNALLFRVEVTATDPHGATASTEFWLGQGDTLLSGVDSTDERVSGTQTDGDILFGGEGTDLLEGFNPTDLFVVRASNDLTVIDDNGFADNDILLLDGLNPEDVSFERRFPGSSDLVISVGGVALVLIRGALNGSSSDQIENIAFADGTVLPIGDVREILLEQDQTTGDDVVTGFSGSNDTIDGGIGDDYLVGLDRSDEYVFEIGDGNDVVDDNGFADTDVVRFLDRSSTDAIFSRVPNEPDSVLISFANGDSVLLRNGIGGSSADSIEQIVFDGDGVTLSIADVRALLIAQDSTSGNDMVVGYNNADTIDAGLGDDYVDGGEGADTYMFSSGDGRDIIDDNGFGDTDVVIFDDYALADATFVRVPSRPNDVIIRFANGDEVILADSFNAQPNGSINEVTFQGSGSDETLTILEIRALILAQEPTAGNDDLDAGNNSVSDTLEAGAGDDFMSGRDGSDTYIFGLGDGRDVLSDNGFGDTDILDLSDFVSTDVTVRTSVNRPNDIVLTFPTGEEITIINQTTSGGRIESFVFSDVTLDFNDIAALVTTTAPGDVFNGDGSPNTLSGNGGYDHLFGAGGNDTYVFDAGDERVEIEDNGNSLGDQVVVNGYSSTDATFVIVEGRPNDLRIVFAGGDEITIRNGLSNSFSDTVETFTFNGDSVTLSIGEIREILVDGQQTAGDDTVIGYSLSDTLEGGLGDDHLSGAGGSDLYLYTAGDGRDMIDDNGNGGLDRLEISGYDLTDATLTRVPGTTGDLLIDFGGGDSILIRGTITDTFADGIEQIVFDGPGGTQVLSQQDIRDILSAQQTTAGNDEIIGTNAAETLEGGLGDDYLRGNDGADTYVYTLGDGNDVIQDSGAGDTDTLEVNGIASTSVGVSRTADAPNTAVLTMSDGSTIEIVGTLNSPFTGTVEEIVFSSDGVTWTMQDLRDQILSGEATSGDDDLTGFNTNDTMDGGTGDDFLSGLDGSDTYIFEIGDGNDTVLDQGAGDTDEFIFVGRDIADATFSLLHDGSSDLLIEFANGDSVVVVNTVPGNFSNSIEEFTFDDGTLLLADVVALL